MSLTEVVFELFAPYNVKSNFTLFAIDGRCASGKTTLARKLAPLMNADVVHTDDFFLPPSLRTPARLSAAGGNIDSERLEREVLIPFSHSEKIEYRPFDCKTGDYLSPVCCNGRCLILEGSYSCLESFRKYLTASVFLSVSPEEQLRRIAERNGKAAALVFAKRWIPMEERYFSEMRVRDFCSACFDTTNNTE